AAFERNLLEFALGQHGKNLFVLAPCGTKRCLPFDIRRNAIAVANMDRSSASQAGGGAMQRRDTPLYHLIHIDIEGRLVELDNVDAVGCERPGFLVEQVRECERHLDAIAVVTIRDGVDDGHWTG